MSNENLRSAKSLLLDSPYIRDEVKRVCAGLFDSAISSTPKSIVIRKGPGFADDEC